MDITRSSTGSRPRLVVVGNGMVGHRFVGAAAERGLAERFEMVVIGGGLLGLEAANALLSLGLETRVIEFAPRLMPLQVDEVGGAVLKRRIEELGVVVHTGTTTREIFGGEDGRVAGLRFSDGDE